MLVLVLGDRCGVWVGMVMEPKVSQILLCGFWIGLEAVPRIPPVLWPAPAPRPSQAADRARPPNGSGGAHIQTSL